MAPRLLADVALSLEATLASILLCKARSEEDLDVKSPAAAALLVAAFPWT